MCHDNDNDDDELLVELTNVMCACVWFVCAAVQMLQYREATGGGEGGGGHDGAPSPKLNVTSSSTWYTRADLIAVEQNTDAIERWQVPPRTHTALMRPLRDDTTYEYRVGADGDGWSPWFNVHYHGTSGRANKTFVLFGDMGVFMCQSLYGAPCNSGAEGNVRRVSAAAETRAVIAR